MRVAIVSARQPLRRMMMDDLPTMISSAKLTVMGVEIEVAVLDNGQRILVGDSLQKLLDGMGMMDELTDEDAMALAQALRT